MFYVNRLAKNMEQKIIGSPIGNPSEELAHRRTMLSILSYRNSRWHSVLCIKSSTKKYIKKDDTFQHEMCTCFYSIYTVEHALQEFGNMTAWIFFSLWCEDFSGHETERNDSSSLFGSVSDMNGISVWKSHVLLFFPPYVQKGNELYRDNCFDVLILEHITRSRENVTKARWSLGTKVKFLKTVQVVSRLSLESPNVFGIHI